MQSSSPQITTSVHLLSAQFISRTKHVSLESPPEFLQSLVCCRHRFHSSLIPMIVATRELWSDIVRCEYSEDHIFKLFTQSDTLQFAQKIFITYLSAPTALQFLFKPLFETKPYFSRTLRSLLGEFDDNGLELISKIVSLEALVLSTNSGAHNSTATGLKVFATRSNITNLTLYRCHKLTDEDFAELRHLRFIKHLFLRSGSKLTWSIFETISAFNKTLQSLRLDCVPNPNAARASSVALEAAIRSTQLSQFCEKFSDAPQFQLFHLINEYLTIALTDDDAKCFAKLVSLTSLILINGRDQIPDAGLATLVNGLINLTELDLRGKMNIDGSFLNSSNNNTEINCCCPNVGLRTLSLGGATTLQPNSVQHIVQRFPSLQRLNLDKCAQACTDESMNSISALAGTLRVLYLGSCSNLFTHESIVGEATTASGAAVSISRLVNLENLQLCDTKLRDDDLSLLAASLPKLTRLNINGCTSIKGPGIQFLASDENSVARKSVETLLISDIKLDASTVKCLDNLVSLKVIAFTFYSSPILNLCPSFIRVTRRGKLPIDDQFVM